MIAVEGHLNLNNSGAWQVIQDIKPENVTNEHLDEMADKLVMFGVRIVGRAEVPVVTNRGLDVAYDLSQAFFNMFEDKGMICTTNGKPEYDRIYDFCEWKYGPWARFTGENSPDFFVKTSLQIVISRKMAILHF